MKKNSSIFLLLCCILLISCSENETNDIPEIVDFIILEDDYEVSLNRALIISIHSGNEDYSIAVEDKEVADAELYPILENTKLSIRIKGKKRGATTVTVTDNVTNKTEVLNVKIISNYISFQVGTSNHKLFKNEQQLFIVSNSEQEFVYYMPKTEKWIVGSYAFSVENNTPYLSLTYTADENGFTDTAIDTTTERFNILDSHSELLNYLVDNNYIALPKSKSEHRPLIFNMKDVNSDIEIQCITIENYLPMGVVD